MNIQRLHPDDLRELARQIADELTLRAVVPSLPVLVDATAIARQFGLSRDTVYERADELGAIRIGDGPRPRLRFDPARVADRLAGDRSGGVEAPAAQPAIRRRRRVSASPLTLLPIRGEEE